MSNPVLKEIVTTIPGGRKIVRALGGLHCIRGNSAPYFSLTWEVVHVRGHSSSIRECGAAHEKIVRLWPSLAPLAALHLSDENGEPMHAAANGYYWIAGVGVCGGLGERYHGGNGGGGGDCADIAAKHFRVDVWEVAALCNCVKVEYDRGGTAAAKAVVARFVEEQRPRWKREADEAIAKLGLRRFGDVEAFEAAPIGGTS